MTLSLEYRKDISGGKLYASRNSNDLRQTYDTVGANRANLDWNLTLRQGRLKKPSNGSASMPNLSTQARGEARQARNQTGHLTSEHEDGPYHAANETQEKYQNYAHTDHMTGGGRQGGLVRNSSGKSGSIDWQLNLRDGYHQKPDFEWRRYYSRPQQSFDMMKENCSADNEKYQKSGITPQDRRIDRNQSALPIETIRDDPISFKRWPGCEGTQVGQWRHLVDDHRFGHRSRGTVRAQTTLRTADSDNSGSKICDNRSDGCIVEMLGKKKWVNPSSYEPLAARPPEGDPKLHFLSRLRILPEQDEENRVVRMSKQDRTDNHISEMRELKHKKREEAENAAPVG